MVAERCSQIRARAGACRLRLGASGLGAAAARAWLGVGCSWEVKVVPAVSPGAPNGSSTVQGGKAMNRKQIRRAHKKHDAARWL